MINKKVAEEVLDIAKRVAFPMDRVVRHWGFDTKSEIKEIEEFLTIAQNNVHKAEFLSFLQELADESKKSK